MTSPPCQSFSLAGKRRGEDDKRGVLFYNSHEFIMKNQPRYFIFENVKGLLSDDNGNTFNKWVQYLGGKSVNGLPTLFPHPESVNYHLYWKVLNAKNYDIPQNRERVFLIGIRDDSDNNFSFPKEVFLTKRLRDVLEPNVDQKYYLSEVMLKGLINHKDRHEKKGTGFKWEPRNLNGYASCLRANAALAPTDNTIKVGFINQNTQASAVYSYQGIFQTLCSGTHGYSNGYVAIGAIRGRSISDHKSRVSGQITKQMLEINENYTSNCLTTVQKDNVVIEQMPRGNNKGGVHSICPTITSNSWQDNHRLYKDYRIRRLTPRECFRLMDFPDSFTWPVSDSQAYKQAGNTICRGVLAAIISKLNLN